MSRKQGAVVLLGVTLTAALGALAAVKAWTWPFYLMMYTHGTGHALWVGMDAQRAKRDAWGWGAHAFCFGPFALVPYLLLAYGARAAAYLPLYVALETLTLGAYPLTRLLLEGW